MEKDLLDENIAIEHKGDYIHVRQSGPDSYEVSLELWKRVVSACEQYECLNILGETFTSRGLSTMEAYDHAEIFRIAGVTLNHRIAWVHHDDQTLDAIQFAETVLLNRGLLNGFLFSSTDEALKWLLAQSKSS